MAGAIASRMSFSSLKRKQPKTFTVRTCSTWCAGPWGCGKPGSSGCSTRSRTPWPGSRRTRRCWTTMFRRKSRSPSTSWPSFTPRTPRRSWCRRSLSTYSSCST
uniref:Neurofibromin 2 n=1 Tax=Myotis myotis TaxID=51298 RepID=A0A7J7S2Q6_MYOMY|nr:neurofibromin 2 [Myotis myotis]